MGDKKYRVRAKCDKCFKEWTTQAKYNDNPPQYCKFCGSYMTRVLKVLEVPDED